MANLHQVKVNWTGYPGGPGVSTFMFEDSATPPLAALRTLFVAFAGQIPTVVALDIPNTGRTVDLNGNVMGAWTGPTQSPFAGSSPTPTYTAAAGAMIRWSTGAFIGGRELRGKTFIVPATTSTFDTNGTIAGGQITAFNNACATFLAAAPTFRIWSRRNAAVATPTSGLCVDKCVVLRSRRD